MCKIKKNPYIPKGTYFQQIVLNNRNGCKKYDYLIHIWLIWIIIYKKTLIFLLQMRFYKLWLDYYYNYSNIFSNNLYILFTLNRSDATTNLKNIAGVLNIKSYKGMLIPYRPLMVLPQHFSPKCMLLSVNNMHISSNRIIDTSLWIAENSNTAQKNSITDLITTDISLSEFFDQKFEAICKNSKKIMKIKNLTENQSDIVMNSSKLPFILISFDQYILKQETHLWLFKA
jgi:hypothetical protein